MAQLPLLSLLIPIRAFCYATLLFAGLLLRTADQVTRQEDQEPSHDDLKRSLQKWRIHVTVADVSDGRQFDAHNSNRYQRCHVKIPE